MQLRLLTILFIIFITNCLFSKTKEKFIDSNIFELSELKSEKSHKMNLSLETGYLRLTDKTPTVFGVRSGTTNINSGGVVMMNAEYFFADNMSVALQTLLVFQTTISNTLLSGYDFGTRYYFWGTGNKLVGSYHTMGYSIEEDWKQFIEGYFGKRTYQVNFSHVVEDPENGATFYQGSYYQFLVGLGVACNISESKNFTLRVLYAPSSFAASGSKLVLTELTVLVGMRFNLF